jgi:hypothetical protein
MALNLTYLPSNEPDRSGTIGVAPMPAGTQVWISPITDARTEPDDIGFSVEGNNTPVVLQAGSQPPAEFVRSVLARELPAFGVPLATEASAATHTLNLQLLKFWVHEGGTYVGEVMVDAALVDRGGKPLWQAQLFGSDKHWGKTFTQENFLNTYSNAALSLGKTLALDPGLRAGIATGQAQPAAGAAAQPAVSPP